MERQRDIGCPRASDLGADAKWDNTQLINDILALRHELAQLLGFANYAEYSLATKMAESTDQVVGFLQDLARRARPAAQQDYRELCDFAREQHGLDTLEAWDVAYYSEKLKQARYDVSQETLRPYFPMPRVLDGLFQVAGRLFDIQIEEVESRCDSSTRNGARYYFPNSVSGLWFAC